MEYVIVKNKQQVLLGPMPWRQTMFQLEIDEQGIDYYVPPETGMRVTVSPEIEIFPCKVNTPYFNPVYEELAGPFWNFDGSVAQGTYEVIELPLEKVKGNLKAVLASKRYDKEVAGISDTINGVEITLDTSRQMRTQYNDLLSSMGENSIEYKSNQQFVTLTPSNVQSMIDAVYNHIQTQFTWEKEASLQIDSALSVEQLKTIDSTLINPAE